MGEMSMFPLGSVLFPATPLMLRLFEPRYLTMLGRLLERENPEFGVVLIERGSEVGGGEQRSTIGTVARIVKVDAAAEAMYLVAVGDSRFEVARWLDDDPHPMAEVVALPPLEWDEALAPLRAEAEAIVRRVAARVASTGDPEIADVRWDADAPISDDPVESSWQLAAIAPLGELDRQKLLRSTTLGGLLRRLIDLTLEVDEITSPSTPDRP
ncbi:LON peptidase substrate-binding domain-containing protein [Microbacterium hominis]|uniref:LON peptidase substrate-binding domain-containing protein n=1 Tax=Microbacterium hominis TaxID=162426 RepID=A0A7D4PTB3_9MICO|nr:LON peptidase substrate-binding domain-containing protein [Microbacterium hominis]QKJ18713.1 LON peptidase substrate-binding domain-containing protein [Microbacterium hominis]